MGPERIERALCAGPADEPIYVPGAHRQPRNPMVLFAAAGAALAAALAIGVVVGLSLDVLRSPPDRVGGPVDPQALAAQLEGTWTSDEITPDAWVDGLLELGHERRDAELALRAMPAFERARWQLLFFEDHLQVFGSFDRGPWTGMSGGPYEILSDGAMYYDDIGCFITVSFDIADDRLSFGPMRTDSCNADETVNNAGFLNLVRYTRGDGGQPSSDD